MLSAKDVTVIYQTLLSSPGMNDSVKIGLHIPRKNILLLAKIIEMGLTMKDEAQTSVLNAVNREWISDLTGIVQEMLQKAGLTEMNEKLLALEAK